MINLFLLQTFFLNYFKKKKKKCKKKAEGLGLHSALLFCIVRKKIFKSGEGERDAGLGN